MIKNGKMELGDDENDSCKKCTVPSKDYFSDI